MKNISRDNRTDNGGTGFKAMVINSLDFSRLKWLKTILSGREMDSVKGSSLEEVLDTYLSTGEELKQTSGVLTCNDRFLLSALW